MVSVDVWLSDYLQWLSVEKGRSRATLESYERDLHQFLAWCARHDIVITRLTTDNLESYFSRLRETRAPSSVARAMSSVRGWLGFLIEEGHLTSDPSQNVRPAKRGRSLPKPLPEALIATWFDSLPSAEPTDLRDRALLEMLYGTGARVSEVVGLRLEDLDFDEDLLKVTGKGNKQRLVPMGTSLRRALTAYLAPGGRDRFPRPRATSSVFLNARGGALSRQGVDLIIARRALDAGVDRSTVSAHVFRHSCATHMLAHGADIRVVQELLGHASIATTQLYTAVSVTSLQREYRSAHPRAFG